MHYSVFYRAALVATVVLCSVCAVLGQGSPTYFPLQINGQVRYADSRVPAANVIVRVERFSGGIASQQFTDQTGKFSFRGLSGQMYTVVIHAPGYKEIRQDVDLLTANTGYVNAVLVQDKDSIVNNPSKTLPRLRPLVIDSQVPIQAQNEYAAAKALLDKGERGKIKDAVSHLDKALALYPKYTEAHLSRGLALMDLKDWDRAEKSLRSAIEISPNASTAYFALGEVYRRQKKYPEAEKVLLDGIKLNAESAEAHLTLAEVYWEMAPTVKEEQQIRNTLQSSWNEAKRALELKPNLAEAHLLSRNLLLRARRAEAALTHFEQYLKLEPKGELAPAAKTMVEKIKQALAQSAKKTNS